MRFGKWLPKIRKFRWQPKALMIFSVAIIIVLGIGWSQVPLAPEPSTVRQAYQASDAWILDRNGQTMESIRRVKDRRSLAWTKWSETSPAFQELLIQVEDKRFYSHWGVDPVALGNAIYQQIVGHSKRGASTLTMQLVGLLPETNSHAGRRGYFQKWTQLFSALKLETHWSKEEIAEAYINLVPFRGELVGLRAASLGYFKKNPSGLFRNEAALLIALLRAPNASAEKVGLRACQILKDEDCTSTIELAKNQFSKPYEIPRSREQIPVLSQRFVETGWDTTVIQTSLYQKIQLRALSALREQIRLLQRQNVNDGAVLVVETKTGRVVAYAANAGPGLTTAPQVDGIQTRRQAGSTIKAFVYALAYELDVLSPDSLLEDTPADIAISQGRVYRPRNYDHIFRGNVSAGEALGSSMNVPAVRVLELVGESRVLDKLRELGFEDLQDDDYYGPSLALGAIDVTLWELTQGYRQLANKNSYFSDEARQKIFDSLAAPEYRRFTFGMNSLLTLPFPAAVKTGTSKDMRDNWCIGWTPEYTVGVWVGNFNGEPMWNVSGMSGAAPIWRQLMLDLHPHPQNTPPPRYLPRAEALPRKSLSRIRYPASGMLVGFDPDIPVHRQRLPIEVENPQAGHSLFLNKKWLAKADENLLWPVRRGRYRLDLRNQEGETIDQIRFEVR